MHKGMHKHSLRILGVLLQERVQPNVSMIIHVSLDIVIILYTTKRRPVLSSQTCAGQGACSVNLEAEPL